MAISDFDNNYYENYCVYIYANSINQFRVDCFLYIV